MTTKTISGHRLGLSCTNDVCQPSMVEMTNAEKEAVMDRLEAEGMVGTATYTATWMHLYGGMTGEEADRFKDDLKNEMCEKIWAERDAQEEE